MFGRRHYLNINERRQCEKIRDMYLGEINNRSSHPYDFDANLNLLKRMRSIYRLWKEIFTEGILDPRKEDLSKRQKEAHKIIFTKYIKHLLKKEFEDKLITKLKYNANECSIKFSDGTKLELDSLDVPAEVMKARVKFDGKIAELENGNKLRM